ncbi:MAG: STAS domain-containing protein [Deltaproteobacteria bacterium]|nr:STAS domain-containing protein [Deltaproteobacteria bacterium]
MSFVRQEEDGCARLTIEGPLTIYEAADLHREFIDCFETSNGLILELDQVGDCDIAGLQLLCSAAATAQAAGKVYTVVGASALVKDQMSRAGLNLARVFNLKEETGNV